MPARGLELAIEAVELVVHPVHVRRERAELVAVGNVDVTGEIARGDRGAGATSIRWIGPITDHERASPRSSARTIAAAATPMNRLRWLAYELSFCAMKWHSKRSVPRTPSTVTFSLYAG